MTPTLFREGFCDHKLAVGLFFVDGGECDAGFAAFPVLHGGETQSDALLVYHKTFVHVFTAIQKEKGRFITQPR